MSAFVRAGDEGDGGYVGCGIGAGGEGRDAKVQGGSLIPEDAHGAAAELFAAVWAVGGAADEFCHFGLLGGIGREEAMIAKDEAVALIEDLASGGVDEGAAAGARN